MWNIVFQSQIICVSKLGIVWYFEEAKFNLTWNQHKKFATIQFAKNTITSVFLLHFQSIEKDFLKYNEAKWSTESNIERKKAAKNHTCDNLRNIRWYN